MQTCTIKHYRVLSTLVIVVVNGLSSEGEDPSPYALSPTYLQYLSRQERIIYGALKEYANEVEERLGLLKRYLTDYEQSTIEGTKFLGSSATDADKDKVVASNPILSFRMLTRYTNEFIGIGQHIGKGAEQRSSELVHKAKGTYDFPKENDAYDIADSILRLQFMYNLSAVDIAEGGVPGVLSFGTVGLTPLQCYFIANYARSQDYYTLALEWLEFIREKTASLKDFPISQDQLSKEMLQILSEHNTYFQDYYKQGHEFLFSRPAKTQKPPYPDTLRTHLLRKYSGRKLNDSDPEYYQYVYANHIALCNGDNFQTPAVIAKLKCFRGDFNNPFWMIGPLKVEVMNENPRIIQISEFIPNQWIQRLQKSAYDNLERAPMGPNATPRTAAYSWFHDTEIPSVPLSKRIEFITGLNVVGNKASEALQVAAYAFGGHVDLHFDSKGPGDKADPKGDRVTTFLIYLNDVEVGGLTSFPKLGFAVRPKKGSAILWYTNLKNGTVDPATLHGACPLLYGDKWIATKWTHINENIFKRPCGMLPEE